MGPCRCLFILFLFISSIAYGQQDVDFHLNAQLLVGKKVLKVKRDFHDPYLWALTSNNGVYRINSITLQVDDYTSNFTAYSSLQFTDIAGRSQDTVFIATNSTNVIEYKKGILRTIGPPDGLAGTINEVGMDYIYESIPNSGTALAGIPALMIATTANVYYYDCINEVVSPSGLDPANNHLYETTYRTEDYSDAGFIYGYDPSKEMTILNHLLFTIYRGDLWTNIPEFGNHIYTAYYTTGSYHAYNTYNNVDFMDQLWGTETGLFENNWDQSYFLSSSYRHYLPGIKVNKVTSIYGLLSFGSDSPLGLTKENLLVGTDNGFYFSSSGYLKYIGGGIRDYNTFTFDSEIGNQVINDVCVDATSYSTTVCEDGVWVAGANGLYYLKPDYGKYINTQLLQAAVFENMPETVSSTDICAGTSVTAVISNSLYSGNSLQWYKDGNELPGKSQPSLVINSSGDYYAVLYDPCSTIHLETNHLQVQVISAPVFSFNYPDKLQYCGISSTILQTDNNPQYSYRWYTNGVLNGVTTYNYTVTQSGKYKVEVSACTDSWVPSKEIEVDLVNLPVPAISADKTQYCAGDNAVLNLNIPADPGYTISWYKDGNLINADDNQTKINVTTDGSYSVMLISTIANCTQASNTQQVAFTPAPVFTFNYADKLVYCDGTPVTLTAQGSSTYNYRWYANGVLNGDVMPTASITQSGKYRVEVSACAGSWVPSKEVQVDIIKIPTPTLQTDKPSYCMGDNATLTAGIAADPAYTINWYKDNVLQTANSNQTSLVTTENGSYSVTVTSNETNTDGTTCIQSAAAQNIVFNPPPTVSIQQIVTTTLCDGQTVDLKVSYNTGTVKWSNGQSSDLITVGTSGTYSATVTSLAGCTTSSDINVQFFPNPVLNLPGYAVCIPSKKTATLTAPEGMVSYSWNGQSGTNTYIVDHPETVTLTITDAHGCQATQDIQVVDECPNIAIPNAFTPNGDGINDTWDIVGLEYDPTATVKIFTRAGQQIFDSKGYPKPWDGEYKGKQLPSGVYYYIIKAKNNSQTYSGPVTIIY